MNIGKAISKMLPGNKLKESLRSLYYTFESYGIYPSLSWYIEHFLNNIYTREYNLQKGDIAVDAGACFGMDTLFFSRKVGDRGKVISIEQNEDNLKYVKRNVRLHKLKNVIVILKGLWSKRDKMKFYCHYAPEGHSLFDWRNNKEIKKVTEIEVDTLDNILRELGIDKVAFIKRDSEGAEIEALKGMEETLRNNDVKLAIASYHKINGQPTYKIIIPMREKVGFKSYFENGISYFEK